MKAILLASLIALIPVLSAMAQATYFPPQSQSETSANPQPLPPQAADPYPQLPPPPDAPSIVRPAPDQYTASIWHQDFVALKGDAMMLFWAAGCGVIGEQGNFGFNYSMAEAALGNDINMVASSDNYLPTGQDRIDILEARQTGINSAKKFGCSFWQQSPGAAIRMRQLAGQP